jgi:5-methyltetrahydropteroyltriglutamate--homocysteine methyltransferase
MHVRTGLTGPFPRSEALVSATRDLDRGRASAEVVEALYLRTEAEVVALEQRLGLDTVTGGYLRWPDLFRPFAETWEGFTVGPLTRWFETNTFYRQPILHAPPGRIPGAISARLPPPLRADPEHAGVILPGPYTFAGLLENRSGETDEALVHRLGRLLAEETRELAGLGYTTFQFTEPLLVDRPPSGASAEAVLAAYRAIQTSIGRGTSLVWTYGGDANPVFPLLDRLPVSGVGVDLAETDWEAIPSSSEPRGLGLGVIDPRTTLGEDPSEVVRIVRTLQQRRRPSTLWLGPGGPLDLVPWEPAARKLEVLPAVRQALAQRDGGSS